MVRLNRVGCSLTSQPGRERRNGKNCVTHRCGHFRPCGGLDCSSCGWSDAAERIVEVRRCPGFPSGPHHHSGAGAFPSELRYNLTSQRDGDSGHIVHRPLRASGAGERRLPGGVLLAAAVSFPGAGLRQGLKNALELAGLGDGTGTTSLTYTTEDNRA